MVDEGIHPFWHLATRVDMAEQIAARPKQRAYLARYGRLSFFEEMTICELRSAVRAIGEVVQKENDANRAAEDR